MGGSSWDGGGRLVAGAPVHARDGSFRAWCPKLDGSLTNRLSTGRPVRGARSVEQRAGAALGYHDVDGVALDGEVGGRGGRDLTVEVHGQRRLSDQPNMPAGQVVHLVVFDKAAVLE